MKERLKSGVIIAVIVLLMAAFSKYTLFLQVMIAVLSLASLSEVFVVSGLEKRKSVIILGAIPSVVVPFLPEPIKNAVWLAVFAVLYAVAAVILVVAQKIPFRHLTRVALVALLMPFLFSAIAWLRTSPFGHIWFYAIFMCAWGSDTGGYTVGRLFGHHKLCPTISPNKTVEGLVGCFVFSLAGLSVVAFIAHRMGNVNINIVSLVLFAFLGAVFSVLGDLCASAVKRSIGIKDYGNLIPGHGGVMDRFDSILFCAPAFYLANLLATALSQSLCVEWTVFY